MHGEMNVRRSLMHSTYTALSMRVLCMQPPLFSPLPPSKRFCRLAIGAGDLKISRFRRFKQKHQSKNTLLKQDTREYRTETAPAPKEEHLFYFISRTNTHQHKMREIVHIQAGQCGNQIGAKVSKISA